MMERRQRLPFPKQDIKIEAPLSCFERRTIACSFVHSIRAVRISRFFSRLPPNVQQVNDGAARLQPIKKREKTCVVYEKRNGNLHRRSFFSFSLFFTILFGIPFGYRIVPSVYRCWNELITITERLLCVAFNLRMAVGVYLHRKYLSPCSIIKKKNVVRI